MISGIIKVSASVISRGQRRRLITLASTLIIPNITKTSSNCCLEIIPITRNFSATKRGAGKMKAVIAIEEWVLGEYLLIHALTFWHVFQMQMAPSLCVTMCSRKYPYPSHGRFLNLNPLPLRRFHFNVILSFKKNWVFETPLPLGIFVNLPWRGHGYFLELHNYMYMYM